MPSIAGGAPDDPKVGTAAKLAIDPASITFTQDEYQRYSRHMIMDEVGVEGQKRLKAASVLCIGTGGLGSPLVLYLAAAGVGRIGLVDFDTVDSSNLQRQIVHGTKDIGRPKIESARETLEDMNPYITVETHELALTSENALDLFAQYDIIVDGTDNFPTRYLVNDACVLLGKPNVYGSIFRFDGQATVFWAEKGPCYRCLYPEPPPPGLGSLVRRRWRVGRPSRHGRLYSGDRSDQIDSGQRRTPDRSLAPLRRARHALQGTETAQRPRLPDLRREPDHPRTDRLRRVLRRWSRQRSTG